ncbi:AraC family transcriptional regulator [Actinomycetospora succinea]|uniref:AraC family transcriptional regulator n=1 Tax=Actinomycetospora succinea TaxID=663603 RepID=A0A4V6PWP5_9PSEU|nr:helix-turn-helix transcriptional regulator [Actinomycetospora succinea]TDQ46727.1 AraC family transcriptional regulator [Actinomycetospora succinea]
MTDATTSVHRHHVSTDDPDVAAAHQHGYAHFRYEPIARDGFAFDLTASFAGAFGVSRMRHTGRFRAQVEPPRRMIVVEVLEGGLWVTADGHDVAAHLMLAPHWSSHAAGWDTVALRLTTLDLEEVERVGAEISGLGPSEVLFGTMTPRSTALARYWTALVDHVDRALLAEDELMGTRLVRAETLRQLAAGVLTVFPNSTLDHRDVGGPDVVEPATVRRAIEFMEAHAHEDVSIAQVAEAARMGPRGLQAAFRRHRAQSPLDYLRRVRMDRAHQDLQLGDPTRGDTVGGIAARWGFANAGRFAVDYRRAYGYSPSETLRR